MIRDAAQSVKRMLKDSFVRFRMQAGLLQPLFLIGHMRSGSSLVVHVLASNPAIVGFGETHTTYNSSKDLMRAACHTYTRCGRRPGHEKYVLDKVLQNHLLQSLRVLDGAKVVFLTRSPYRTIDSIVELGLDITDSYDKACAYYTARMEWMRTAADELAPSTWTHVDYDDVTSDTTATLNKLTRFLQLMDPLRPEYETDWYTGRRGIGDPSAKIQTGRIIKNQSPTTEEGRRAAEDVAPLYEAVVGVLRQKDSYRLVQR